MQQNNSGYKKRQAIRTDFRKKSHPSPVITKMTRKWKKQSSQ